MNPQALFAFCLVGILLVAFGCTGSDAGTQPAQTPDAIKPTETKATPPPATPPAETPTGTGQAETPKETAPESILAEPAAEVGFANSKCTLNTEAGDMVMLFKDISHYKTEVSKDGKLVSTMWTEGNVIYTLPAGQVTGVMSKIPETTAATGAGVSDTSGVMPEGMKYSCVPATVSDADVTHPASATFMDLSALGAG